MAEIKVTYVDLNSLKTYQNNPKDHPQKQVHQIADSIKKFGFNNPILIDESNEIIAGHGRYMAAQQLQMETVPVIRLTHLDVFIAWQIIKFQKTVAGTKNCWCWKYRTWKRFMWTT